MLSNHDSIAAKSAPRIAIRGRCVASPTLVSQVRRIHPCMVQNLCTTRSRASEPRIFAAATQGRGGLEAAYTGAHAGCWSFTERTQDFPAACCLRGWCRRMLLRDGRPRVHRGRPGASIPATGLVSARRHFDRRADRSALRSTDRSTATRSPPRDTLGQCDGRNARVAGDVGGRVCRPRPLDDCRTRAVGPCRRRWHRHG